MNRPPIWLAAGVSRCVPSKHCYRTSTCARALVSHDGRPLGDFTLTAPYGAPWSAVLCTGYLRADDHRQAPQPEQHKVHEAPKGII